jgi:hypothetical protein
MFSRSEEDVIPATVECPELWVCKIILYINCFSPPTFYEIITSAGSTWWNFDRCMFLLIELNFLTNFFVIMSYFFLMNAYPFFFTTIDIHLHIIK